MGKAISGELFLVKLGDGATTEVFTTVGQLTATQGVINNTEVDFTNKDSGGWRELHAPSGIKSMQITGAFVVDAQATHDAIKTLALARPAAANFELVDGAGKKYSGNFYLPSFQWGGPQEDVVRADFTLSSTGIVTEATA